MEQEPNKEKIIDEYTEMVIEGLPFDQVRKALEKENYPEEDIKFIVRKVDDQVMAHQLKKPQSKLGEKLMWAGLIIMTIGLALTLAHFYNLIYLGNSYLAIYGPFLSGMIIYFMGKSRKRKE